MPNKIVLSSIPHSGTKLVAELFKEKGYIVHALAELPREDKVLFFGHIINIEHQRLTEYLSRGYPLVVPLRHPFLGAKSWERRGLDLTVFIRTWKYLVERLDEFHPLYIPVDSEGRDGFLLEASNKLELDLQTDWPIVNSFHNTYDLDWKTTDADGRIVNLVEDIKPFLNRFYK